LDDIASEARRQVDIEKAERRDMEQMFMKVLEDTCVRVERGINLNNINF
jgi:hypothetical protein